MTKDKELEEIIWNIIGRDIDREEIDVVETKLLAWRDNAVREARIQELESVINTMGNMANDDPEMIKDISDRIKELQDGK